MFLDTFHQISRNCDENIRAVKNRYPFDDLQLPSTTPRITFQEAVNLLSKRGIEQSLHEDLSTETEKALAEIIKEKYNSDFFVVYNYPKTSRPFYTMPNPEEPETTNSYDFFLRGEEILSGAQRIHNCEQLLQSARDHGIDLGDENEFFQTHSENSTERTQSHKNSNIINYANSFRYGSPMHAGAGIGLERIIKLSLGLDNIRKCSMFPRDPKRLYP